MDSLYDRILTGSHKQAKRLGRGIAAGGGKTAGRGTKGQRSRTGSNRQIKVWFEGGQTPLHQRLAKKRGFAHITASPVAVTTRTINEHFVSGETVTVEGLLEKKLIRPSKIAAGVKIIGNIPLNKGIILGEVKTSKPLTSPETKHADDSHTKADLA